MNAVEIEEAVSQLAEQPFDPAAFPFAFLEAYGNKETTVKRLRKGNSNKSKMEGGVLQRNNIHIATCEPGAVADMLRQLQEAPETASSWRSSSINSSTRPGLTLRSKTALGSRYGCGSGFWCPCL